MTIKNSISAAYDVSQKRSQRALYEGATFFSMCVESSSCPPTFDPKFYAAPAYVKRKYSFMAELIKNARVSLGHILRREKYVDRGK